MNRETPTPFGDVSARLAEVRRRIAAAGGDAARVRVVAVTKGFSSAAAAAAVAAGCVDLGENYAAPLVAKAARLRAEAVDAGVCWHLIGGIQRRSIRLLAPYVGLYETVDRSEEGAALARHHPGAAVLVEVDTTGLPGRGGVAPGEVPALVEGLVGLGLDVQGLMTVAAPDDAARARRSFAEVSSLVTSLGLREASMGMSDDLELAVAEGSTMVRVGRALFGPRPAQKAMRE
ncbi:MAG: alanine racemase [Acidimicrobiales bacterium]